jgi:hypothetical protein
MADDIKLKYGSTGFEKVARELASLEKQAGGTAGWFTPMQKSLKEAEAAGSSLTSSLGGGLGKLTSVLGDLVGTLAKVGAGITAVAGIAAGAATAAFISWSTGVLKTTESFRLLEISMYGATKSWDAVGTASKFAKEYAAEYPAMYKDVMQALQSFAYIPALRPMIQRGDVVNMKEMMTIVQGMMTMRPEQGVQGAIYALREAMAGNWRSLMYRFDIPIASIAESAGMTMEQMKQSPDQAIKALKAFIDAFVGAETMAMAAKNLSVQVGNLRDKYEMWLDDLGKTGIYQKVVGYVIKLNDVMDEFMKSDKVAGWTKALNALLESIVDRIAGVFTKGIDWQGIVDLAGLMDALKQVAMNAADAMKEAWDAIKDPLMNGLKTIFKAVAEATMPIIMDVFLPIGKEIGIQIIKGVYESMAAHPIVSALLLGGKGAMMGAQMGGAWGGAIGGAAGVAVGVAPAIIEGIKGLGGGKANVAELAKEGDLLKGISDEQMRELEYWKNINKNADSLSKSLQTLIDEVRGGGKGGGAGGAGAESLEARRKREAAEDKMASLREKSEWGYYQQWSKMGSMLAGADIEAKRKTGWQRYLGGEIDWSTMKRQERVEKFQEEQLGKLGEMVQTEESVARPNYGVMSRAYGEMFNVAYQKGDFGKAQEFMNKSLDAMREDMRKQAETMAKELNIQEAIQENTAATVEAIRSTYKSEAGLKTRVYPAEEPDEIYWEAQGGRWSNA